MRGRIAQGGDGKPRSSVAGHVWLPRAPLSLSLGSKFTSMT